MALHRARQAAAEWLHGELQWEAPRRMPERARVLFARRSPQADRSLAHRLQRRTPALEPRLSDPNEYVANWLATRSPNHPPDASFRTATGRTAAVCGASAPRPVAEVPVDGQNDNGLNL